MLSIKPTPSSALRWQPLRPRALNLLPTQRPAPRLLHWLADTGSLTARLQHKSHGHFRVEILRQVIARPQLSEQRALGMKRSHVALIREVVLYGQDEPWVFARSVLPLSSLTGSLRHLRKQGTKPLGAFLFSHPYLKRSPISIAAIKPQSGYVPAALLNNKLWARRSVFYLMDKPLLVSEVFLQAFCARLT